MAELDITADFVESLTIDDIEAIEDATGLPFDQVFSGKADVPKAKMMRAIVFVLKRRDDPEFTMAQAGRVPVVEVDRLLRVAGGAPPVPLPGSGPSKRSRRSA